MKTSELTPAEREFILAMIANSQIQGRQVLIAASVVDKLRGKEDDEEATQPPDQVLTD